MNERIRQLARQSTGASTIYMLEEEWLMFAELIIKECLGILDDLQEWPSTEPKHCAKEIRKHFGVEG